MERVSDRIGEAYKNWGPKKPIVIHAPTGSGKTYFILNVLLPYIHRLGKKMVYLCNRSALRQQVKHKLSTDLAQPQMGNSIITYNYHQLAALDLRPHNDPPPKQTASERVRWEEGREIAAADYYIFDEAHFFLSDAGFNLQINDCLKRIQTIQDRNPNAIWIYMTATIPYLWLYLKQFGSFDLFTIDIPYLCNPVYQNGWEGAGYERDYFFSSVKQLLEYKECPDGICQRYERVKKDIALFQKVPLNAISISRYAQREYYFRNIYQKYMDLYDKIKGAVDYYEIKPDYSYINPVYFSTDDDLLDAVKQSAPDEKWLIFVESLRDGNALMEKLRLSGYPDTVFLTSKTKNESRDSLARMTYASIVENEAFSQKVVISTKVLDNGVNLCDRALKHIVIQSFEETTFLQMLGRKRIMDPTEEVRVYLRDRPEGSIRKDFQMRIQSIILFWYQLYAIQERNELRSATTPGLAAFQARYIESGHYKNPYRNYIGKQDMRYANTGKIATKDNPALMVDLYTPPKYTKAKLVYDYYKMLAMFERVQNERWDQLFYNKQAMQSEDAFTKSEQKLISTQFMWLREQLSWMGLKPIGPLDPSEDQHWIHVQTGAFPRAKDELLDFLSMHTGILTEEEERKLKQLYCDFVSLDRPPYQSRKEKGSVQKINQTFERKRFPYHLTSKKRTYLGKQRNWWILEHLTQET